MEIFESVVALPLNLKTTSPKQVGIRLGVFQIDCNANIIDSIHEIMEGRQDKSSDIEKFPVVFLWPFDSLINADYGLLPFIHKAMKDTFMIKNIGSNVIL